MVKNKYQNSSKKKVILITGTSKGIGHHLVNYYIKKNYTVIGCSRTQNKLKDRNFYHYELDISDEKKVVKMFIEIRKKFKKLDVLINNAGVASMNHSLLTPMSTVKKILSTNIEGLFLMSREASKIMQNKKFGRIINFSSVAAPLNLEGEAIYAASKSAVVSLTKTLAKELGDLGITVNGIGPTPVKTDLIKKVPIKKINELINKQTIKRYGTFDDITNISDFLIKKESNFITGQIIYMGGL